VTLKGGAVRGQIFLAHLHNYVTLLGFDLEARTECGMVTQMGEKHIARVRHVPVLRGEAPGSTYTQTVSPTATKFGM